MMRFFIDDKGTHNVFVFFCGYMFGSWSLQPLINEFSEYTTICFFDIGSDIESHDTLHEEVNVVLSSYQNKNIVFLGYSLGGFFAQYIIKKLHFKPSYLVLLGSCFPKSFSSFSIRSSLILLDYCFNLDGLDFFNFIIPSLVSTKFFIEEKQSILSSFSESLPSKIECYNQLILMELLINKTIVEVIESVDVLILHAETDHVISPSYSKNYPNANNVTLSSIAGRHLFVYESAIDVSNIIKQWLKIENAV